MRCTACDRINANDAHFCVGCGTPLVYGARAQGVMPGLLSVAAAPPQQPAMPAYDYSGYGAPGVSVPANASIAYPAQGYPPYANAGASYPTPGYSTPGYPPYAYPPSVQVVNNITMPSVAASAASPVIMLREDSGPNLLIRALWFLVVGLWLGAACTVLAWLLNITIIGLPLGLYIINRLPRIMTLKPVPTHLHVTVQNGVTLVRQGAVTQHSFAVRALYFLLVGSWASLVWLLIAWVLVGTTLGLGLPLAFWMFDRVPAVTTLAR